MHCQPNSVPIYLDLFPNYAITIHICVISDQRYLYHISPSTIFVRRVLIWRLSRHDETCLTPCRTKKQTVYFVRYGACQNYKNEIVNGCTRNNINVISNNTAIYLTQCKTTYRIVWRALQVVSSLENIIWVSLRQTLMPSFFVGMWPLQ